MLAVVVAQVTKCHQVLLVVQVVVVTDHIMVIIMLLTELQTLAAVADRTATAILRKGRKSSVESVLETARLGVSPGVSLLVVGPGGGFTGTVQMSAGIALTGRVIGPGGVPQENVNINVLDHVSRTTQPTAHDATDAGRLPPAAVGRVPRAGAVGHHHSR